MNDANRCSSNRRTNETQCKLMMADSQPPRKSSLSIHDARIAGLYDLEETIGKGHFAVVKLASHVFTGEKVAVKVIDKTKFDATMASHFMQEVRCMKLVQHPNIVRLYEVIDTHTKLFLILELGDYDMYDFIMKNADKGCPENEAQQYFCQIIKAIDYCHKLHVVHRDLKPENVVFFEKLGMVKLTDFGFSNKFTPGEQLATSCGSLAYSAPEILLGDAYDAPAVDVWSLGVILYMLLCGRLPFQEANDSETLTKILDCKYSLPETLSAHARNLISRMLVKDASKRATLQELVENHWVAAGERGLAQVLPLVGRDILPESAHATIVEQMVAGGVDTEERILRSLENDDYSYTTATYYLLAERVLSSYREERAREVLSCKTAPFNDLTAEAESANPTDDAVAALETNEKPSTSTNIAGASITTIPSTTATSTRCRSRSNSWRGSTSTVRRLCTILKEESEEELSTYLRTSSRQSSRYDHRQIENGMNNETNALDESLRSHSQRQNAIVDKNVMITNENEHSLVNISDYAAVKGNDVRLSENHNTVPITTNTNVNKNFDELSPIREHISSSFPPSSDGISENTSIKASLSSLKARIVEQCKKTTNANEIERSEMPAKISSLRHKVKLATFIANNNEDLPQTSSSVLFKESQQQSMHSARSRANSAPAQFISDNPLLRSTRAIEMLWRINRSLLSRRNSSPSISMFAGVTGSKERISPQAIQELLELSRLSVTDGRRRAVSPDSRRSSRSPSPPSSSGRSSPAINIARIKGSLSGTGGMRKLSSSPHLLGICEESEESEQPSGSIEQRDVTARRSVSSASGTYMSQTRFSSQPKSDTSSTASGTMLTYSKVRMIRPRQAVVSPDMARRYESHPAHRFGGTRTRRSTSCSSSEASDDDSSERRMNLLVSKCCRCSTDNPNDDEDPSKDGGGNSFAGAGGDSVRDGSVSNRISDKGNATVYPTSGDGDGANKCRRCLSFHDYSPEAVESARRLVSTTPLHPIMEIPSTLLSGTIFTRSEIAERAVADWTFSSLTTGDVLLSKAKWMERCCVVGTPPRYGNNIQTSGSNAVTSKMSAREHHLNCDERSLRKSCSLPIIFTSSHYHNEDVADIEEHLHCSPSYYTDSSDEDIFSDEELDSSLCWTSTDSGCSSDSEIGTPAWQHFPKLSAKQDVVHNNDCFVSMPSNTEVIFS